MSSAGAAGQAASTSSSAPQRLWPGWSHLTRDARDTLFLLSLIGWTVLPHLFHLPLWCAVLTAAVLLTRGVLALKGVALPNRWSLVGVLVLTTGLTFWSYGSLLGKEPGVAMAVALMAIKTLELRARRDAFVVFFLGFFLILTQFLYSQSLLVALAMLVSVWGLLSALVLASMPVGKPPLSLVMRVAGKTALLGAPLMVLMFMLFPRINPLWGVPQDNQSSMGLSNTMSFGSVAVLAQNEGVAMRLRFDGPPVPAQAAYFRGPVLGRFDGMEWTVQQPSFPAALTPRADLAVRGEAIGYEVTLEPLRLKSIPLLDASTVAPQIDGVRVTQTDDLQWLADQPLYSRVRFRSVAHTDFSHGPLVPLIGLQDYIDLPAGYNPRTLAWAMAMRRQPRYAEASADVLAAALMEHIRTGGYSYTLTPGAYGEVDARSAVDEFWLDRKLGFCEHFAAAFVVVMRALDVPARVVTGYQGFDATPVDGYHVVRHSNAHAWAEYWREGVGWVRADPTTAVAPERVLSNRRLVAAPGLMDGALGLVGPRVLAQFREGWEAVNNRWNQWVLDYSRGTQLDLLARMGFSQPDWQDLAWLMVAACGGLSLAATGWAWWERQRIDPWKRQMTQLRAAVLRLGVPSADHDSPRTLAQRVRTQLGESAEPLARAFDAIDAARYGRHAQTRPDPQLTREFTAHARRLAQVASVVRAR
jgi:transglutaminase-like putative cysteine protease